MSEEANPEGKSGKDIKKILAMVYVVLNLGAMGAGSFLVYTATLGYHPPQVSSEELNKEVDEFRKSLQDKPMSYTLETVNTNLAGLPRRLVRAEINLEMLDAEGFEEIINLGAKGRDAIVRIFNEKTFDDIESVQGKLHLKNEIIGQLNSMMDHGVVKDVYFSDFVVQ